MAPVQIKVVYDYYSAKRTTPFFITEKELLNLDFHSFKSRLLLEVPHIAKSTSAKALRLTMSDENLEVYLFQQYLDRGAQFSEAGLNGALFNINLHTNNILQNTKFQITKVLT